MRLKLILLLILSGAIFQACSTTSQYILEQALEKQKEETVLEEKDGANQRLHDIWYATHIKGVPTNRSLPIPRLELNLSNMSVLGYDGCNEFYGRIHKISATEITFDKIVSPQKACADMKHPNHFNQAIGEVTAYKLDGLKLSFLNHKGKEILIFLKGD
ncbi:META domain-containing protein [Aureispira anguillae]|uniref:META domain-containing protein n=1 Tax=Aureispira anguillae TaxID=2864201 RepID=A0A915YFZ9_9BACT|nr:META domain-containing protein [Aureispira anguillae]BDS12413.1 META domain-containing protein [Aureispira anguillae]